MQQKVYLFANNMYITHEHVKDLDIDMENDIIVLFNYMCVPYDALLAVKHKIAMLRVVYVPFELDNHYLGGVAFIDKQNDFEKLVCIDDFGKFDKYIEGIHIPYERLNIYDFLSQIQFTGYTDMKIPTSGFIAYLYMSYLHPDKEIILVGFTGRYPDGTIPDKIHHDYDWEQQYYNDKAVKRVLLKMD
jgi:hypothetical protein